MVNSWLGAAIFLVLFFISIMIRVPHDRISKATKTAESRKDLREKILLSLMALGTLVLPLLSFTNLLAFASYQPIAPSFVAGIAFMVAYLWLFHRSHADLGKNWSVTLELREEHKIVDQGVYRHIRHPMYAAIYLMAIGQAFLIPNWVAGPATLIAFTLMFTLRLEREEQMMLDRFGAEYQEYRSRTKCLIPGVW